MLPEATERFGRAFDSRREDERFGQVVEIPLRRFDVAQGAQPIKRVTFRRRRENRHSASPIRDLDRFALFGATEEFTGPLSEFPDADGRHVLLIARTRPTSHDRSGMTDLALSRLLEMAAVPPSDTICRAETARPYPGEPFRCTIMTGVRCHL